MTLTAQTLTVFAPTRFRAASGEGVFFDPINSCMRDNSEKTEDDGQGGTKGTWMTLEQGAEVMVVGAYGTTFFLIVNEHGTGLKSAETYGLVVRDLSMKKILANVLIDVAEVPEEDEAQVVAA